MTLHQTKTLPIWFAILNIVLFIVTTASATTANFPAPSYDPAPASGSQSLVVAGGCFWGVQAVFQHVKGVKEAISGYAGGSADTAQYNTVSTGTTGHAESVKITYDPSQVSLGTLLKIFFSVAHDPTELNRQGPDTGSQYRSAIFTTMPEQRKVAEAYLQQLQNAQIFPSAIVTKIEPLQAFYPAEAYHQNYATLHPDNPYIARNDTPKLEALRKMWPEATTGF